MCFKSLDCSRVYKSEIYRSSLHPFTNTAIISLMSKKIETNQKHMNQDNRVVIEKRLDASVSFRAIGIELGKDPTTIAKEVKKHRVFQGHNKFDEKPYRCANARDCHRKNVCSTVLFCRRECRNCNKCHIYCLDYKPFDYHCPLTDKAPFVCNGCPKKNPCRLDKYYYRAVRAQNEYKTILMESRRGINLAEEELAALDATVSPLILNGQSPYMILQNHPEITQCEKTIYNYIDQGTLSVCNLDLPKRVTYKPRQAHASEMDNTGIFEGRTYKDYEAFIKEYPDSLQYGIYFYMRNLTFHSIFMKNSHMRNQKHPPSTGIKTRRRRAETNLFTFPQTMSQNLMNRTKV